MTKVENLLLTLHHQPPPATLETGWTTAADAEGEHEEGVRL